MTQFDKTASKKPYYGPTYYGLYHKNEEGKPLPLPLKTIDVNVKILDSVAKVEYSQIFENNTDKTLHVYYIFPISTSSCFDGFSAKYKSTTLEGEIHKKDQARKKYTKAVKEGKTVIYAEISDESEDLMSVKIGNMEPSTSITINLSYIEQLDTSANKLWKYTVLGGLKPRYKSNKPSANAMEEEVKTDSEAISILNYPYISSDDPQAYKWKISVEIESSSTINFIECPTYKIKTEYDEMSKAVIKLDPSEEFKPTQDFTIYFSTEELNKPKVILTQYDDGYCAMINFVPQTNHKNLSDAYKIELEKEGINIPDIEFEKTKGEFIFILDRSGSMSGSLIKMAREALVIFLKSLPSDAYFNIVSFGGDYQLYSKTGSLLASQENVQAAVNEVLTYEGDMGGTEILTPLEAVYRLEPKQGTKKKIFLLTDGEVYNMKAIFRSIQEHAEEARVFSVGIGKSASRELIIQTARYGKGCYEFVDDANKISERVISLLTLSMQICAHSFQLTFPMGLLPNMVIPHPEMVGPVYEGKYLTFFVFFGKDLAKRESVVLNLVYKRDEKLEGTAQGIEIKTKECLTDVHPLNQAIYKLGFHKLFSIFGSDKSKSTDDLVFFGGNIITRHEIEPLSIRYGVLSQKTAFICVLKDENNNIVSTEQAEIVVPHILKPEKVVDDAALARSRGGKGGSRGRGGTLTKARSRKVERSLSRDRSRSLSKSPVGNSPVLGSMGVRYKTKAKNVAFDTNTLGIATKERARKKSKNLADDLDNERMLGCGFDAEEEFESFEEEERGRISEAQKQREEESAKYSKVFSIINQQDSTGKWEYSEVLLNILGIDVNKFKENIPENVKSNTEALTLSMTALVMICLKQKFSEHKSVWMLVYRKADNYLKGKGLGVQDFKGFEFLC